MMPKSIYCVRHRCWLFEAENCKLHRRSDLAVGILKFRRFVKRKRTKRVPPAKAPATPPPEPSVAVPAARLATLSDIVGGLFQSATDKNGSNGILVEVKGLTVLDVKHEADGDFHIAVTDGTVPRFITELTPAWQQKSLAPPSPDSKVDITGFVFADQVHAAESSHGSVPWEIHPITAWRRSVV